ncbi:MAG: bifunctional methionine sulfoxide reductase B/A protein [Bacteroidota bacterium]|nr:bifunctional methionine sulfoxide reductase B/A protein [Bacteroidota bacterium]
MLICITFVEIYSGVQMDYNKLNSKEKNIILEKGTEPAFSGKFNTFNKRGIYTCKRCDAPLYNSDDKFVSSCGWPSFDDEIADAIKKTIDADGVRTEITCANCGAHLGHIFTGEHYTAKNIRHCVNSLSMNFIPNEIIDTVIFAGGCFWGTEYKFSKVNGVIFTEVGYTGGDKENPNYIEVSTSRTGHAECVQVTYNSSVVSFEELAKLFFETHDFTQIDRQGPDIGNQYRSEIFVNNNTEREIAEKLINILEQKNYKVATQISKTERFWKAEKYHQKYFDNRGETPTFHSYKKIFK